MSDVIKNIGFWAKVAVIAKKVWDWLCHITSFLNDPRSGKVSSKRIAALGLVVATVRQLAIRDYWGALIAAGVATVLFAVAAITKT
jgi:hypothetical protein